MIAWRGLQLLKAGRNMVGESELDKLRYDDKLSFSKFEWE